MRLLVQSRVVDRDAGGGGQRAQQLLVVGAERPVRGLPGEVEAAEDLVFDPDRHPEEATHWRVVDRVGVAGEPLQPQRSGVGDQPLEESQAVGTVLDMPSGLLLRPDGDELRELAVRTKDAERPVPSACLLYTSPSPRDG